jgi:hypothetical protein
VSESSDDHAALERAYIDDLIAHTREHGPARCLRLVSHSVVGSWPNTELRLVVAFDHWPGTLYGLRDHVWDEDPLTGPGPERAATYTWLRLEEMAATGVDLPPPQPDDDGITWADLWPDD